MIALVSCGELNLSPYIAETNNRKLNNKNLVEITNRESSFTNSFKVAVISDTHDYYKELEEQISYINSRKNEIAFVIHTGDATNLGMIQEYDLFLDELEELDIPFLVLIGNHDMLSNGTILFKQLFGNDLNFTLDFKQTRFIMFNNNNWESSETAPNINYIEDQLSSSSQTHNLLLGHVQFDDSVRYSDAEIEEMENLVTTYSVSHVINGHNHNPGSGSFSNATRLTVGSPPKGKLIILSIDDSGVTHEFINF